MKSNSIIKIGSLVALAGVVLLGCDKAELPRAAEIKDFNNLARVQVFNATAGSPGSFITLNGTPVNNTAAVTYGNAFPSASFFLAEPGLSEFVIRPSSGTVQPQVAFPNSLSANTWYSIFTYDTVTAIKQVTVQSNVEVPTDTTSRLRFANFMYSKTNSPNVDIYSVKAKAVIFSNVATTQVTPFIPFASKLLDTLIVRQAGTTTVLTQFNNFTATSQRVYTAVLRGSYVTPTTTAKTLSILTNL